MADIKVTYLFHSGFVLETESRVLVFDYFQDPANALDLIDTDGKQVLVFVSHSHADHFNPKIFSLPSLEGATFVLSSDVLAPVGEEGSREVLFLEAGESALVDGVEIATFASTDKGVAFLLKTASLTVYHAGDLHWWDWDENTPQEAREEEGAFKAQLALIATAAPKADIAFVPVDSRLGMGWLSGLKTFMNAVDASHVFPMHFSGDPGSISTLPSALDPRQAGRITALVNPGDWVLVV